MPEQITESVQVSETESLGNGRYRVLVISAGVGSSGIYPPETLQEAANKRLVTAGTHSYWDHPSVSEDRDRPERSVRDLVGVFTSDAAWDEALQGLVADYQVFSPYRPLFEEMRKHVGLSIRGDGEVEMRDGKRVITALEHITSVDVVTRAGRGGKVLALLESAHPDTVNARAVANGVAEATANELREQLQDALKAAFGAEDTYVWVRDFDDSNVWFDLDTPGESATWQQPYELSGTTAVFTGAPVKVIPQTRYVPVDVAEANTLNTPKEGLVPELTEAEVTALRDSAAQAEAARDAALAEAATARTERDQLRLAATARPVVIAKVAESKTLGARTQARLVESIVGSLPIVDGKVADEAITAAVETAVKAAEAEIADYAPTAPTSLFGSFGSIAESAGDAGTEGGTALSESEFKQAVGSPFGRKAV